MANRSRRAIASGAALALVLILIFPPFLYPAGPMQSFSMGFAPIWTTVIDGARVQVNTALLAIEILALTCIVAGAVWATSRSGTVVGNSEPNQGKSSADLGMRPPSAVVDYSGSSRPPVQLDEHSSSPGRLTSKHSAPTGDFSRNQRTATEGPGSLLDSSSTSGGLRIGPVGQMIACGAAFAVVEVVITNYVQRVDVPLQAQVFGSLMLTVGIAIGSLVVASIFAQLASIFGRPIRGGPLRATSMLAMAVWGVLVFFHVMSFGPA